MLWSRFIATVGFNKIKCSWMEKKNEIMILYGKRELGELLGPEPGYGCRPNMHTLLTQIICCLNLLLMLTA